MTVTVYSKPNCPQCHLTCLQLQRIGLDYVKIDITQDTAAYEVCKALGYMSVPVVVVGDEHWSGFRPDRLAALAV